MELNFLEVFLYSFFGVAVGYALLAGFTPIFYKKKAWGQLTRNELKVKQGTATIENKMDLLIRSFFTSLFTYQVYLIALLIAVLVYAGINYLPL
ncbi:MULTISPECIES: hypothetical protein [Desulfosediminicola]|uniref:hypothetical protein n=1 Tax=Desulfosediminicola TaxID=2886823 RepID=UPI0010AC7058|nr:hypothetical protein [Desulfosediminicola ganghwensis]